MTSRRPLWIRILLWLGALSLSCLVIYFGIIFTDASLDPRVAALDSIFTKVSAKALKGYQLTLGFIAPDNQDAAKVGEEVYVQLKDSPGSPYVLPTQPIALGTFPPERAELMPPRSKPFLEKEAYTNAAKDFATALPQYRDLLNRLDQLIQVGEIGTDLPPSPRTFGDLSPVFYIWNVRLFLLNEMVLNGHSPEAIHYLKAGFQLHRASLENPAPLLVTLANVAIMRSIRTFVEEASKKNPAFSKALDPQARQIFQLDLNYNDLMRNSMVWETGWLNQLSDNSTTEKFQTSLISLSLKYNPKRIKNWIYRCWMDGIKPTEQEQQFYPGPSEIVNQLCGKVIGRAMKIEKELSDLRAPFN